MRKRITQQDKKLILYELQRNWAEECLDKLAKGLEELFKIKSFSTQEEGIKYRELKGGIKLQLKLLEIATREIKLPSRKKEQ